MSWRTGGGSDVCTSYRVDGIGEHNLDTIGKSSCRGVALITAMLIVALVSVVAVGMTSSQWLEIRRTGNVLDADRAALIVGGVEAWALGQLAEDGGKSKVDHLAEDWAKALPTTQIAGGEVSGTVVDLNARFNLNNLVVGNELNPLDEKRFRRLLSLLDIDAGLVQAVADWMDANLDPRFPNGAEDDLYLRKTPPYRAANRPFADASELLLIEGMTAETYRKLEPFICALPQRTDINVNTAGVTLLRSLAENLGQKEAEALADARQNAAFEDIDGFLKHPALAGLQIDSNGLDVASDYFRVSARAHIGRGRARVFSTVSRSAESEVRVIYRTHSTW